MRTKLIESNKPERYIHNVRNVDTSAAGANIPIGSPLILNLSNVPQPPVYSNGLPAGWEDGLQVVLPASASALDNAEFFYGFAAGPILYGQLGETMIHGVGKSAVFRQSRANTTSPWTAQASAAGFGLGLSVDTVNNAFGTIAGTATSPTPVAFLIDDLAAVASSASNSGDTRLVLTQLSRTFIRQM